MIDIHYKDETGRQISFSVIDWDAVLNVAQALSQAPIELSYVEYKDGNEIGIFNLQTFEKG